MSHLKSPSLFKKNPLEDCQKRSCHCFIVGEGLHPNGEGRKTKKKHGRGIRKKPSVSHPCKETEGSPQLQSLEQCDTSEKNNVLCETVA